MNDLIVSSAPHSKDHRTVSSIMAYVLIALSPAAVASVIYFRWRAFLLLTISILSCLFFEFNYNLILKRKQTLRDCSAIVTGVLMLGILFMVLVVPPTEGGEFFICLDWIGAIGDFCRGLADVAGWWLILWIPAAVAILLMFALFQNGLIYFGITMGAVVAKRHKLIAAIGIYYGVNLAVGLIGEIVLIFLSAGIIAIIMAALMAGGAVMGLTVTAILYIFALAMAVLSAILHFMTVNKLERKLNLA